MKPALLLTIRRRTSGYKVACFSADSLEHAWTVANLIGRSPEYSQCFVVATDWTGQDMFAVGAQVAAPFLPPRPVAYRQATIDVETDPSRMLGQ